MTLIPPPQYDVPPAVPIIERVLPFAELQRMCRASERGLPAGWAVFGCLEPWPMKGRCQVFILAAGTRLEGTDGVTRTYTAANQAATRRHELAHCNGWPSDHPGGRE